VRAQESRLARWQLVAAAYAVVLCYAGGLVATPARAENWQWTPSISVMETYTNNANLAPSGQAQSSFVTTVAPAISVSGTGARVQLSGTASLQGLLYLGDYRSDSLYVQANLLGRVEAVEDFFFVDGAVNVSQQYLSPFGAQPVGNIGVTDNRYTSVGARLSPYIQGVFPGEVTYLLRNDNIWSNLAGTHDQPGFVSSYVNRWYGRLDSPIRTFGWTLEGNATSTKFTNEPALTNQLVQAYLRYRPDPQLQLYAIGGYEWNDYFLTESSNWVYGGGGVWRPSERTNVSGQWEERFFGSSYFAGITHRNPFTAFNVNASRNIATYPQQLFAAPAGGNVAALVDAAFATRIPDPVQRAQAVQEFLRANNLPSTLQSPINFYTQQVSLYEQQSATFTLLGTRNSAALTLYNRKSEVISGGSGEALPPPFGQQNNNTQRGVSLAFSHRLTGLTSLNATVSRGDTTATAPFTGKTTSNYFVASAATRLSPKTDGFAGLTYTDFESNVTNDYNVFTVYVGLTHRF
jgi:uncharacterized protein (PEP-CTERM system associated)